MTLDGRIIVTMELLLNMQEGCGYFLLMFYIEEFCQSWMAKNNL